VNHSISEPLPPEHVECASPNDSDKCIDAEPLSVQIFVAIFKFKAIMANFQWPSAWPVAKDRVECVFQADKYAGLVKSISKKNKTMRVWFDDESKHTWKCEADKTWEIIQRYEKPKVSFCFLRRARARISL